MDGVEKEVAAEVTKQETVDTEVVKQEEVAALKEEVSEEITDIATKDEALTEEGLVDFIANYAINYTENNIPVTTEDLTKFMTIENIEEITSENPELAAKLFGVETKETYLNGAAKVIGATVMYDFNVWNSTKDASGFVKVSDSVYGDAKEQMIKIEEYVSKIADAANADDKDLVNELCAEFITELNSGSLSKLDCGVGFGAQIYIALIADGIARNYLDKENFDMFQILKTSEKYVSDIFTIYEGCNTQSKTQSR